LSPTDSVRGVFAPHSWRAFSSPAEVCHYLLSRLTLSCPLAKTIVDFQVVSIERLKRITLEEGKCGGRPCIRGFRLRVSDVLELLAGGASFEEILADYPFLEREDILAAIEYAARQADHSVLHAS
jgi:uncharacterized protein (DUF433 family)